MTTDREALREISALLDTVATNRDLSARNEALDEAREKCATALSAQGGEQAVCGACGKPWDSEKCGQAENGHPFPTCYPVVQGGEQSADTVSVPREATPEMILAGMEAFNNRLGTVMTRYGYIWEAMLAAAKEGK